MKRGIFITIRPISDLQDNFSEIGEVVLNTGEPVFSTKNGYGSMVVMSLEQYSLLTDELEFKLDEAPTSATSAARP